MILFLLIETNQNETYISTCTFHAVSEIFADVQEYIGGQTR